MFEIRNSVGTSKWSSVTGAWQKDIYYFHAQAHDRPYEPNKVKYQCSASGCFGVDIVGAHIRFPNKEKKGMHIIPLCRSCNSKGPTHEMQITNFTPIMPANRVKFEQKVKLMQKQIEARHKAAMKAFKSLSPKQ